MKNACIFFSFLSVLLTSPHTRAQEQPTDKRIPLHVSDYSDLVHFVVGDYVFSFSQADLLEPFAGYAHEERCAALLPIGDTLDFQKTADSFFALGEQVGENDISLSKTFYYVYQTCIREARLKIHSTVSGKDLVTVRRRTNGIRYTWLITDPISGSNIYGVFRHHVQPSF